MKPAPETSERPPRWATRLLALFCAPHLLEEIQGDLEERFQRRVGLFGERVARRAYVREVLSFLRPFALKRRSSDVSTPFFLHPDMLRNYLRIAFRTLAKNRVYTLINLLGLAVGMAACLMILQYVSFELSFDRFHADADRIYRVTNDRFQQGKLVQHGTITYPTIGPTMAKDYEEIEAYTTVVDAGRLKLRRGRGIFPEERSLFADPHFFNFFSFPLLAGDARTALQAPNSLVLSETNARRIFGVQPGQYDHLLGQTLLIDLDPQPYRITGILRDVPAASHLQFGVVVSYETLVRLWGDWVKTSWEGSDMWHYLKLRPGRSGGPAEVAALERKFPAFSARYFRGDKVSGSVEEFHLQPLTRAHLYSDYEYEIGVVNNGRAIWTLLLVAVFILLIAWINHVNLATARSLERAREVGVRKVAGATRGQLVGQFLAESALLNLLGLALAVGLTLAFQPTLNHLVGRPLSLALLVGQGFGGAPVALGLVGVFAAGLLLSGCYPAFALSSFRPVQVLKGSFKRSTKGIWVRRSLVVVQYVASFVLIAGTIIVYRQLEFMRKTDLGFNMDRMLVVTGPDLTRWDSTSIDRINSFKAELTKYPTIKAASATVNLFGDRLPRSLNVKRVGLNSDKALTLSRMGIDLHFFETYKIPLLAGRNFLLTDSNADGDKVKTALVNASAARLLGFRDATSAVGQKVRLSNGRKEWEIVGVVGDFHQQSLRYPIEPIIFQPFYANGGYYSLKITPENLEQTLAVVKQNYKAFFPGNTFRYLFMDEEFNRQYHDDQVFGSITSSFSLLAVLIASLGLFGLSSYAIAQRTKEIGVRKVMGASVKSLIALLSADFLKLVLLAIVLATPLAWYAADRWLEDFAYKIDVEWWVFVGAGLLAVGIALLTVSFQSVKAALTNPVKSLRSE